MYIYLGIMYIYIYQILIVTGGHGGSIRFDSTEIYRNNVWTTVAAKLPDKMFDMRATTFNNRVLVTGILRMGGWCTNRIK